MGWPFKGRKKIMAREGKHRIISADTLEKLEFDSQRKEELEAENQELLKRPCVEKYEALQSQLRDLEGEVLQLRPLKERVPALEQENQRLDAQVAEQGGIIQQLQQELAQTKEESRRRGSIIQDLFNRYLPLHRRLTQGSPREDDTIAICNRDVGSLVASAQLMRTGKVGIDYAMRVNWHQWLPRVRGKSRNPNAKNPIATKEVIIVGFYPTKEEARKHLEPLHANGVRVVLILDRKDTQVPDFVSAYRGSSLATALAQYLKERGIHDEVYEILAALGDASKNGRTEETSYLRDALYDPTNTGAIRSVVTQLSRTGTVVGTPIYRGIIRRAEDYRALKRDGFRI